MKSVRGVLGEWMTIMNEFELELVVSSSNSLCAVHHIDIAIMDK